MPQARQRAVRPVRGQRGGGRGDAGLRWLLILVLVAVGAAIVVARTTGRTGPRSAEPTLVAPATATSAPAAGRATPEPAAAPLPTARPTAVATVAATAVRPRATPTPTQLVVGATATPVAHAAMATPAPTVVASNPAPRAGAVALTFDAGADRGYAEDILDSLSEEHVVASFGITGTWARANPDLVRRMATDGHLVFNHTLDHHSFTGVSDHLGGLSPAARRAELDDADAIIAPLIGHSTRPLYRLPYGDDDTRVAADVLPAGYSRKIGWTVDSLGWRGAASQDIVTRCVKLAAPGGVYVFHVGRASQDAIALPQIIHALRDKGFGFLRADQV